MYANCTLCGEISRYLVDTDSGTTEARCDDHAEDIDIVRKVNHKRNTLPLSNGGSGTSFRATCSSCDSPATCIIRFEDGLGVISTEARCEAHVVDDYQTRHDIGDIDIKAQDLEI